jgi:hypothetical protein
VHAARCRQADILSAVCSLEFGRQDVARTVADRMSALRWRGIELGEDCEGEAL